jgi:hypothetical protein
MAWSFLASQSLWQAAALGRWPQSRYAGIYRLAAGYHRLPQTRHDLNNFYKDPHFKSVASGKEPPERTGCEGCHGPGRAHVDARGDLDTVVYAFSVMKPQEVIALCLNCHAKEFSRANIRRSEHTQHDVACTACHSIHNPATARNLLAKRNRGLLPVPHRRARAVQSPSKHRVNGGSCHAAIVTARMAAYAHLRWARPQMPQRSHRGEQPCLVPCGQKAAHSSSNTRRASEWLHQLPDRTVPPTPADSQTRGVLCLRHGFGRLRRASTAASLIRTMPPTAWSIRLSTLHGVSRGHTRLNVHYRFLQ